MQRNTQKQVLLLLAGISVLYFILFIPVNFSGADELSKIRILSSIDEYAQLTALNKMLDPSGKTTKRIIGDFLLHHHAYGYPFFFFSSLAAIPVKVLKLPQPKELQWTMLALRQQVVLFNILICLLLVYIWTGFQNLMQSAIQFIFLLAIPAVNKHNLIWHPDALSTLFITLTLLGLIKDGFKFKRWFFFSAIACGLACSTKFMGPFLALMILAYFAISAKQNSHNSLFHVKKFFVYGTIAIGVFVVSSPLLVFGYCQNMVEFLTEQSKMNNFGWGVQLPKGLLPWYGEVIHPFYFNAWICIGLVAMSVFSIFYSENKTKNILTLAAIIPIFAYVIIQIAHKNYFYLYPVFLFLAATIINFFSAAKSSEPGRITAYSNKIFIVLILVSGLIVVQNTGKSFDIYKEKKDLSSNHPSFIFYKKFRQAVPADLLTRENFKIVQSPFIYLPDSLEKKSDIPYDFLTTEYIAAKNPDIILFEKQTALNLTDINYQKKYINPEQAQIAGEFYKLALTNSLPGYTTLVADDYGIALIKKL